MPDRVIPILEEMEESLESGEYEVFRDQADSLVAAYDEQRPEERQFIEKAKALSRKDAPDRFDDQFGDLDAVSRFLVRTQEVKLNRTGTLVGLLGACCIGIGVLGLVVLPTLHIAPSTRSSDCSAATDR